MRHADSSVEQRFDAAAVHRWSLGAVKRLDSARAQLDALNVFPIADRDTGANLVHTMTGAAEALADFGTEPGSCGPALDALATGAVLAAHGNSGMVLAQVLRALADTWSATDEVDATELCSGLAAARTAAYAAVHEPVEGTMLSVLAAASTAATAGLAGPGGSSAGVIGTGVVQTLAIAVRGARAGLDRTSSQLDSLSQAGVVDAGGLGLLLVLQALLSALIDQPDDEIAALLAIPTWAESGLLGDHLPLTVDPSLQYEVQYVLRAGPEDISGLRSELARLGDSVTVAEAGDGRYAVHVHVVDAGAAIEAGIKLGQPERIRLTALPQVAVEPSHRAAVIVALVVGGGVARLFEREGVTVVAVATGMPPDAQVLSAVLLAARVDRVVLLPNSRDATAPCEAAAELTRVGGVEVAVVPTTSAVQGLAAVAVHDPTRRFADDVIAMAEAAAATRVAEISVAEQESITYAGRCEAGDVLGLIDGEVVEIGSDYGRVANALARRLIAAGGELVTVLAGADPAAPAAAEIVRAYVRSRHPLVEVTVLDGGQSQFPLVLGVE